MPEYDIGFGPEKGPQPPPDAGPVLHVGTAAEPPENDEPFWWVTDATC